MIVDNLNPRNYLRIQRLTYFGMFMGLIAFLIIALYLADGKYHFNTDLSDPLMIASLFLTCIFLPGGYILAKIIFNKIKQNELLINKFNVYQNGQMVRLAMCEGNSLFAIIGVLLTSNLCFLIFLLINLCVFILYYPTPEKIGKELNLTETEISMFNE